ncbi:hypothetical protein DFH06DRAFT_1209501 [Mycena polygramma]|nr:hypothetical protein DFH06DRAFT_1209501 [Mycena polygramma]
MCLHAMVPAAVALLRGRLRRGRDVRASFFTVLVPLAYFRGDRSTGPYEPISTSGRGSGGRKETRGISVSQRPFFLYFEIRCSVAGRVLVRAGIPEIECYLPRVCVRRTRSVLIQMGHLCALYHDAASFLCVIYSIGFDSRLMVRHFAVLRICARCICHPTNSIAQAFVFCWFDPSSLFSFCVCVRCMGVLCEFQWCLGSSWPAHRGFVFTLLGVTTWI